ncbi:MAG: ATP-binding protein [Melioribacteraceae bacterium]
MPRSGGSSTDAGVIYELWYATSRVADIYFNPILEVTPQAKTKKSLYVGEDGNVYEKDEIVHCDDLLCRIGKKYTHYNIKTLSPNVSGYWTTNELIRNKIIEQFKNSFESPLKPDLVFVSQNPCRIFTELINRAKNASDQTSFTSQLVGQYLTNWSRLKDYLQFNDLQLLDFSKYISTELTNDHMGIRNSIEKMFYNQLNDPLKAALLIHSLVEVKAIRNSPITYNDLIEVFNRGNIFPISQNSLISIKSTLLTASSALSSYKNYFQTKNKLHLHRSETDDILNWTKSECDEIGDNVMVLVGGAGSGKSSILKDVLIQLQKEEYYVIGIKSDQFIVDTREKLESELSLSETLANLLNKASLSKKTVLIIDQIDALSQYLSVNRNSLKVYLNMVRQFQMNKSLKIILSCRTFDLDYDPTLAELKNCPRIVVKDLDKEQINQTLSLFNLSIEKLPIQLQELIKIPLHLNIFCKIYNPEIHLERFATLQDLYEELWNQKFSVHSSNGEIELLFKISEKMSSDQVLSIPKYHFDKLYKSELADLAHEGLIVFEGNNIQFFHQTFFDYVFACSFVAHEKELFSYITGNHQGIFIRSSIIQVLEYYRSVGYPSYAQVIEKLLTSDNIRYHIKHLILFWFSKISQPTTLDEKLFNKLIRSNAIYMENFIEMLTSKGWVKYLIKENIFLEILTEQNTTLYNILSWRLRWVLIDQNNDLFEFLWQLCISKEHINTIANILMGLKNWNNPLSFKIFDKLKIHFYSIDRENLILFIFSNAIKTNPIWVLSHYAELTSSRISEIDKIEYLDNKLLHYQDIELIKELYKFIPNETAAFLLKLFLQQIDKSKEELHEGYYTARSFWAYYDDSMHKQDDWITLDLLTEYGINYLSSDKNKFNLFFEDCLETKCLTIIGLFLTIYNENPKIFRNDIYNIIMRESYFLSYTQTTLSEINTHKAINLIYPILSKKEQTKINTIILNHFPSWETSKEHLAYFKSRDYGYSQFTLMKCLNEKDIKGTILWKRFQELNRRFNFSINVFESRRGIKGGFIGSPLPKRAYEKMSFLQWLSSFKSYNEKPVREKDVLSGGLSQHASEFRECVKNDPDKYYDFLYSLDKENVPIRYISEGIYGLKEAKYDMKKLKRIVKKYALKYKATEFRRSILFSIDTLVIAEVVDSQIIKILEAYIENDQEAESKSKDAFSVGINTVKGEAIRNLTLIGRIPKYFNKVFPLLLKYSRHPSVSFRACMIHELVYLIRVDKKKVLELFLELVKDRNEDVSVNGLRCSQYLMKEFFPLMLPYIEIVSNTKLENGNYNPQHGLAQILLVSIMEKVKGSKEVFENLISTNDLAIAGAVNCAIRHLKYTDEFVKVTSHDIYLRFLNSENDKIYQEYEMGFNEFTPEIFLDVFPLLKAFSSSKVSLRAANRLYDYLEKVILLHPVECLELLQNFSLMEFPDNQHNAIRSTPIKLLVQAYNNIRKYEKDSQLLETAMDTFDKMLSHPFYKAFAVDVLKSVDNN